MNELRAAALEAIITAAPEARCRAVGNLAAIREVDAERVLSPDRPVPGRPARPRLVAADRVPHRDVRSLEGRAALLHSLAHIEFNAIGLALDAIWRFAGMPTEYYFEWRQVALEEARHYSLLAAHLATLGYNYGDFDAHDGLWDMATRTREDVLDRMALVPRMLEARGLDASPKIRAKLAAAGDSAAAAILDLILEDEIGHVAIGNRWFHWLCARRSLEPVAAHADIATRHRAPRLRGPFNLAARRAAGFTAAELEALQHLIADSR